MTEIEKVWEYMTSALHAQTECIDLLYRLLSQYMTVEEMEKASILGSIEAAAVLSAQAEGGDPRGPEGPAA